MTSESLDIDDLLAHSGWVRSLAIRLLQDSNIADDVVQETWVAALRHPPEAGRPLRPWLATVVRNLVRRRHRTESRRTRRELEVPQAPNSEGSDELLAVVEEQQRLAQDVMALPEPYRGVLLRRFWREMEPVEIARALGVPAATVRSQLHRGLGMLREQVRERFGGEHQAMCLALLSIGGEGARGVLLPVAATAKGIWIMNETTKLLLVAAAALGALFGGWHLLDPARGAADLPAIEADEAGMVSHAEVRGRDEEAPAMETAPSHQVDERASIEVRGAAVEASAADVTTIHARFVDEAGTAISAGTLTAIVQDRRLSADSDEFGVVHLSLDEVATRLFREQDWMTSMEARAAGRVTLFFGIAPQQEDVELGDITLEHAGRVSGHVVDEFGRAVVDALVQVSDLPLPGSPDHARRSGPEVGKGVPSIRTDASGRFHIDGVKPGDVRLWASIDAGHYCYSDAVEVRAGAETSDLTLVLRGLTDDNLIAGHAVDPEGKPIPKLWVMYQLGGTFSSDQIVTTDVEGYFEIVATEHARHTLTLSSPTASHTTQILEGIMPGTTDLRVELTPSHYMNLRVKGPGGEAVSDFTAELDLERGNHQFWTQLLASEVEGAKRIAIPDEPYVLTVDAPGYERLVLGPLRPGPDEEVVDVELQVGAVYFGRVTRRGEAVEGATVSLHSAVSGGGQIIHRGFVQRMEPRAESRVVTDAEGRFQLDRLERGDAYLIAKLDGWAAVEVGPLGSEANSGELDLRLTPGGSIAGQVQPRVGQAARGILVSASRGDGQVLSTRTDEEGMYGFDTLTPGDWYVTWHELEAPQSTSYSSSATPQEFAGNCVVVEERETWFEIDLAGLPRCVVSGSLLFDGEAQGGWTARLVPSAESVLFEPMRPVRVGADGSFELESFTGSHQLILEHTSTDESAQSLQEELQLDSDHHAWSFDCETGGLHGVVDASRGAPLVQIGQVMESGPSWKLNFRPDASGEFDLSGLPVGEVTVHAMGQKAGESYERWHRLATSKIQAGSTTEFVAD